MNTKVTSYYVVLLTIMFCISAAVTACPPPPPPAYVTVCGDINTNTIWTADKTYYVACNTYVNNNATLTIEPGTVVKFDTGACLFAALYGKLIAEGTAHSYITFTSKYDCTVGETIDSNQQPQMHDWGKIGIKKDSKISFCKISYANEGIMIGDFPCPATSVSIQHNMIKACNIGIITYALMGTGTTLNIFNNLITNCQNGIYYQSDNETANLNIVNNTVANCTYDAMFIITESEEVDVYNNLISGCNTGIRGEYGGAASPRCSYNAFHEVPTEFLYVDPDLQGTNTNVHPDVSPFDTCVLGPYFLNDDPCGGALLIDKGYDDANQGMLGYTTQCYKISDEAPVDIGFHYPSDYDGHGGEIIFDDTFFSPASAIHGGLDHSLFMKSDNTVWVCGSGYSLGLGIETYYGYGSINPPQQITFPEGVEIVFVDAGSLHSLAVDSTGNVWAWGMNSEGQIGVTGDPNIGKHCVGSCKHTIHWSPIKVEGGEMQTQYLTNIKKVSTGIGVGGWAEDWAEYSLSLDNDGGIWSWGRNDYSISDSPTIWYYGQLGIGSTDEYRITPVKVLDGESGYLENIVDISAGIIHAMACDSSGYVWAWGYNGSSGVLGQGTKGGYSTVPVKVLDGDMNTSSGYLENIVDVAASGMTWPVEGTQAEDTSYALDADGHVWAWGDGFYGKLGDNGENCAGPGTANWYSTTPIKVKGGEMGTEYLENIIAISAGNEHVLALDKFGRVWAWGNNGYGQVGNGGITDCLYWWYCDCCASIGGLKAPVRVRKSDDDCDPLDDDGYLSDIVAIDAGGDHSMAIDREGNVWVWGNNAYGQLGWSDYLNCGYTTNKAVKMTSWSFCPDP